jgi:hypothetical protein
MTTTTPERVHELAKQYGFQIGEHTAFGSDQLQAFAAALTAAQPALSDAADTLSKVCDVFHIGSKARTQSTILMNVENARRRSNCLWAIEHEFFMMPTPANEDEGEDEPGEECLLNWGQEPAEYVKQFGEALKTILQPVQPPKRAAKTPQPHPPGQQRSPVVPDTMPGKSTP